MTKGVRSDETRSVVGGKKTNDWKSYISRVKERMIEGVCGVRRVGGEERESRRS
jgi:hypothetical protein